MIDSDGLRKLFHYDPETGVFTCRVARRGSRLRPGDVAGSREPNGYLRVAIDGRKYRLHRLAWLYMTGEWPLDEVDHKNLDKSDNRWANLRSATSRENRLNRPIRSDNKSGFKGVSAFGRGRWRATLDHRHLGLFDTPEEAAEVYQREALRVYGEFARW